MKKSLVLAMAMALGVTASAYAANPFSDVPAGHWAYDSISQLTAAGVVEGYPDGSFKGQNLMTRYEMAQIVAKAMAKGANVDKLAAEFADELNKLGVRVTALEKKADNVKIYGQARYVYSDTKRDGGNSKLSNNQLRTRLWLNGQINEDWSYWGMLQNTHQFNNYADEQKDIRWSRAWVEGKLGGLKVTAGRFSHDVPMLTTAIYGGSISQGNSDSAQISYGKDVKLTLGAGKGATGYANKMKYANLQAKAGKAVTLNATIADFTKAANAPTADADKKIWTVGAKANLSKDLVLYGEYLKGNNDKNVNGEKVSTKGWTVAATYKGASAKKPGSWGLNAQYYDLGTGSVVLNGMDYNHLNDNTEDGFKGYIVGLDYAVAKNIVALVRYIDLKGKDDFQKDLKDKTMWYQLNFTF